MQLARFHPPAGWTAARVAGLSVVAALAMPFALAAQQPSPPRASSATVEVSATGTYEATPDQVDVAWRITGKQPTLRAAYAAAQAQAGKVRELLRQQGFPAAQAHWSGYQVQPDVDYKTQTVTGYTVAVELQLKFTDFHKIGPLLDAAGSSGLNALRGVSFDLKDREAAKSAAIADGYEKAHREAAALAAAAGRKLAGLQHATVDVSAPATPRSFGPVAMLAERAPAPVSGFSPQLVTITARVTAVYRLAP